MMTATTKTFNIAGAHTGNVIIADEALRDALQQPAGRARPVAQFLRARDGRAPPILPTGAAWVDALVAYLDGNRRLFDAAIATIPGVASMPLEATYLAWVDFSGTGMERDEFTAPGGTRRPDRGESRADLRQGRRELPALQHRHAAGPDRGGLRPAARGLRRSAIGRRTTDIPWACRPGWGGGPVARSGAPESPRARQPSPWTRIGEWIPRRLGAARIGPAQFSPGVILWIMPSSTAA